MKKSIILFLILLISSLSALAEGLAQVEQFHPRATGYAGSESATYLIFKAQVQRGEEARETFQQCLKKGTPAGRLYGAVGLWKLDPEEGQRALTALASDQAPVDLMSGCLMMRSTVGEIARDLLSEQPQNLSLQSF